MPRKSKLALARSAAAKRGWEKRWENAYKRGGKLGPKGRNYINKNFGPDYDEPDRENPWESEYDSV